MKQKEFHEIVSIEEARKRLHAGCMRKAKTEKIPLRSAHGRVIAENIVAPVDVPPFDRAAMDGYALSAPDTFNADEENPAELELLGYIQAGKRRKLSVKKGKCAGIATGAPVPKGANAVVMVEFTERERRKVRIYKPIAPGENIMAAGSDIMRGETVLRAGEVISPRESGVLAALGLKNVLVYRKPLVGIVSTGDEIVEPGKKLKYGEIYDVNSRAIADAVRENGGEPEFFGIVGDRSSALLSRLKRMVKKCDVVIVSGGTSAGVGDMSYRVFDRLGKPGVLVHGIAIKPGKPTIIAVAHNKPIFGLPGYPASAMVVFDVFAAPIIRELARRAHEKRKKIKATTAMRIYSGKGRYEYLPVNLVSRKDGSLSAYPVLKSSGAITTLADADGYIEIPGNREMVEEGSEVEVTLFSDMIKPADLAIIGSHCIGVDIIIDLSGAASALRAKIINVGSSGGLAAAAQGEADVSGIHIIDAGTGVYNLPFLKKMGIEKKVCLVRGYDREQGLLVARGNPKGIGGVADLLKGGISFINRNAGSGTRVLLDLELGKIAKRQRKQLKELVKSIEGYEVEAKSHSAVAAAIAYGKADAGLGIKTVAEQYNLGFVPLRGEKYDFLIPKDKMEKPAVKKFLEVLKSEEFKKKLKETPGLRASEETGKIIHYPE